MPTDETTQDQEVIGSVVYVIHVDESDAEPVRTAISLLTKDDLNLSVDEEEEELNLAAERRTRRYRTHNTADLEVSAPIDVDMEAAELAGIVDTSDDGRLTFGTGSRRLRPEDDEYIEVAFFDEENMDYADAELVHRFEDVEAINPEVDISSTPPLMSWTWAIHGTAYLGYEEAT